MNEIKVMIAKKVFLQVCIGIESLCAELYHYYSRIYGDIPEASRLWKKTALEEENHQKQFELALRLINESEFELSKNSLKRAFSIKCKLQDLLEHVKNNKPELLSAVSKAIEMEESLADLHAHTSLHFRDKSMQSLFKALSDADHDHVADMQRYRNYMFMPLCEIGGY
jgi:rubrerythrin